MKRIFYIIGIVTLPIIVLLQLDKCRRYHAPSEFDYVVNEDIDKDYFDPDVVLKYYQTALEAGTFARHCWKVDRLDVRRGDISDPDLQSKIRTYQAYLSSAKYLENKLLKSAAYKSQGLSNEDIQYIEENGLDMKTFRVHRLLNGRPGFGIGDVGSEVMEIQKLLQARGKTLQLDGVFDVETESVILDFQKENMLYPSGKAEEKTLLLLFQPDTVTRQ